MTTYTNPIPISFAADGVPKTGLSPTIDIYRRSDSVKVISAQACTEVGSGFYQYNFTTCDTDDDYDQIVDSNDATLTGGQRYAIGVIDHTIVMASVIDNLDAVIVNPTKGSLLFYAQKLQRALVNKLIITNTTGNTEMHDDDDVSLGTIATAFSTDGTFTNRRLMVI